jgi:hypothetical protein
LPRLAKVKSLNKQKGCPCTFNFHHSHQWLTQFLGAQLRFLA